MRIGWYVGSSGTATASVRLRALLPIAHLVELGHEAALWTRDAAPFDVVVFSKIYDDSAYEKAQVLRARGTTIVFDLCDNHWFGEATHSAIAARAALLARMIGMADRVTTSTDTLARQFAARFTIDASRIAVVPDPVIALQGLSPGFRGRMELWGLQRWLKCNGEAKHLIWFGNHGAGHVRSGLEDLERIRSAIEHAPTPFTLTIVSNSRAKFKRLFADWRIPVRYVPWRLDTIDHVMVMHDAAVIPITASDFTVAKTMNRPATALMAGLDVFADRIPSYDELSQFIVLDAWEKLSLLSLMASDRSSRMEAAQSWLAERYSPQVVARRWEQVLSQPSN